MASRSVALVRQRPGLAGFRPVPCGVPPFLRATRSMAPNRGSIRAGHAVPGLVCRARSVLPHARGHCHRRHRRGTYQHAGVPVAARQPQFSGAHGASDFGTAPVRTVGAAAKRAVCPRSGQPDGRLYLADLLPRRLCAGCSAAFHWRSAHGHGPCAHRAGTHGHARCAHRHAQPPRHSRFLRRRA